MTVDLPKYLEPQTLAKLQGLELRARTVVEGFVYGAHRSPFSGYSIEFVEHREYSPGDDLRYVDWKVFGKTDKYYLKRFEQETNLVCELLVDVSESMNYCSSPLLLSKIDYAKTVAASLAHLILRQQDSVGLVTWDDELRGLIRSSGNPSHLKAILSTLEQPPGRRKTKIGPLLHDMAQRFRKRGLVILLSDWFDQVPSILAGLKHFHHQRHDVIVMQVLDPAELDFPFQQTTRFKGLEQLPEVLVEPRALRRAYLEEFGAFRRELQLGCRQLNMDYLLLRTDQSLQVALSAFLSARMRHAK